MSWQDFIRPHLRDLKPYRSARDEFKGQASVFLDANESPYPTAYNRYPDPRSQALREALANYWSCPAEKVALFNGSDEIIDLLMRALVDPTKQAVGAISPSYGMYEVSAAVNGLKLVGIPLSSDFDLDQLVLDKVTSESNLPLLFLCSPNNPTGNSLSSAALEKLLVGFKGLVVVDEAYVHYQSTPSWVKRLHEFENLAVMQTFSKALGLADLRVGALFGGKDLIDLMLKIKPPYNVSGQAQKLALDRLKSEQWQQEVQETIAERERLSSALRQLQSITKVWPSQANFILIEVERSKQVYQRLLEKGIVVRDRSNLIENSLRISIGTPEENNRLLNVLKEII